jgi:hypothetical protein
MRLRSHAANETGGPAELESWAQRQPCGARTSPGTISTWRPQPVKEGLPHLEQIVRLHMLRESQAATGGFAAHRPIARYNPVMQGDAELLEKARSGDARAVDELLARQQRQVFRFGLRMLSTASSSCAPVWEGSIWTRSQPTCAPRSSRARGGASRHCPRTDSRTKR